MGGLFELWGEGGEVVNLGTYIIHFLGHIGAQVACAPDPPLSRAWVRN